MKECVFILAPHTDDGELGCGGSIVKFLEKGMEVYYIAFSTCEDSIPHGLPLDTLKQELYCATNTLGIKKENIIVYNYPVRRFYEHRQDILENMVDLNKRLLPSNVMMPSPHDTHQDHIVIATEGMRAFKHTCLLAYEEP
jgi:LmbE family N-acetylglucosaminyl deacetylase